MASERWSPTQAAVDRAGRAAHARRCGRAAVLSGLSQILMLADRHDESEQRARQAIEVTQQVPDGRSIEGHARCNLGVDLAFAGCVEEGIAELRTAIRIADEELEMSTRTRGRWSTSAVAVLLLLRLRAMRPNDGHVRPWDLTRKVVT